MRKNPVILVAALGIALGACTPAPPPAPAPDMSQPPAAARSTLVYASGGRLFTMVLGEAPVPLTAPADSKDQDPSFSADGRQVVFLRSSAGSPFASPGVSLRVINRDGQGERELATCARPVGKLGDALCISPIVTRDGRVYYGERISLLDDEGRPLPVAQALRSVPLEGGASQVWSGMPELEGSCAIGRLAAAPDHGRFLLDLRGDNCAKGGTYLVDPAAALPAPLAPQFPAGVTASRPTWGRGDRLLFPATQESPSGYAAMLFSTDLRGGDVKKEAALNERPLPLLALRLTADGARYVGLTGLSGALATFPAGAEAATVTEVPGSPDDLASFDLK